MRISYTFPASFNFFCFLFFVFLIRVKTNKYKWNGVEITITHPEPLPLYISRFKGINIKYILKVNVYHINNLVVMKKLGVIIKVGL